MIPRLLHPTILRSLQNYPIVGIIGARQTGKTTLARALGQEQTRGVVYLDLEVPSDLTKLTDAELYLRSHVGTMVIIDEVQRKPELFPLLRALGQLLDLGAACCWTTSAARRRRRSAARSGCTGWPTM
jgi:uncharacterized protein